MKVRHILPAVAGAFVMLFSCTEKGIEPTPDPGSGVYENPAPASAVPGHIRIKLSSDPGSTRADEAVDLSSLGDCRIVRTFPDAGKFEQRHRKAGLHLWYDVFFDESLPLTKAAIGLEGIKGIDVVEYVQQTRDQSVFPFNDPGFSDQWHYYNTGSLYASMAGCDINLLPAWELTTGRPDVIVAVSDGGLDVSHEDLAANMWVNEAEMNGTTGVDDDNNGYVDDIYGYNFVVDTDGFTPKGSLEVTDHGVHVGGTIAAVNNNGVGVCGVAGGNGSPESGARLMSTQTSGGSAYLGAAIAYAADNGAVLLNCSWTIDSYEPSVSEAIDYFNQYAGMDINGNQVGPMAGGLAIFAAGNDTQTTAYPAQQDNVFAVAAVGADYVKSYYTNMGTWVDIAAPGGDTNKGFLVYSTLPGNSYGGFQGTSMACPHVTGTAALVVSRFGGPGFTRQSLIDILTATANPVIYDYHYPQYAGMLGAGLIDAGAAVSVSLGTPEKVEDLSGISKTNVVTLSWTIPEGEALPQHFNIYWQKTPFESLTPTPESGYARMAYSNAKAGDRVSYSVTGLEFGTQYYFLVSSGTALGAESEFASCSVTTGYNTPPTVSPVYGTTLTLKSHKKGRLEFNVSDPDGQELECSVSDEFRNADVTMEFGRIKLIFNALDYNDGEIYNGHLYVTDGYDTTDTAIALVVEKNNAPQVTTPIPNQLFGAFSETASIDLSQYIEDADSETLSYTVKQTSGNSNIVSCSLSGKQIDLKSLSSYGTASFLVSAVDTRGAKAEATFSVLVRDGSRAADLYPNPVKDKLNVRVGSGQTGDVVISNKAGAVVLSQKSVSLDPFSPLQFDMSELPGGVYYVTIKADAINETFSVVKQ